MSNMKCPFCGEELETMFGISESVLGCHKCRHIATIGVWQALIDGKKAQDALKVAMEAIDILYNAIHHNNTKETCHIADHVLKFASERRQILKGITSITKQDKMS